VEENVRSAVAELSEAAKNGAESYLARDLTDWLPW